MTAPWQPQRLAAVLAAAMLGASVVATALTPRHMLADTSSRRPLDELVPRAFGAWREARDIRLVPPAPDVQAALDQLFDGTLARAYRDAQGHLVMISLSYGRSQFAEGNLHRPEVCYAAQGFAVEERRRDALPLPGPRRVEATRLLAQGPRPEPVTYWLVVGDHVARFGLERRLAVLSHGLRGEVADGMLVRISSIDVDADRAFALHDRFVRELAEALPAANADRLFGADRHP